MWRFDNNDISHAQSLVEAALAAGMNLIDTADIYGFQSVDVGFGEAEENLWSGTRASAAPS